MDYFYQYLQGAHSGAEVEKNNLAQDGDRSHELLHKLQHDAGVQAAVSGADVITVSIGGNNLMQAAEIPGFTSIDWGLAEQGTQDFEEQWPAIVDEIRELNGSAKIIVLTVFNPYNRSPSWLYRDDRGLFDATEPYLARINGTITEGSGSTTYAVANAHQAYLGYQPSSMGSVTYMYPPWYDYLRRNPHPKALGQQIITDLHKEAYEGMGQSEPPEPETYTLTLEPEGTTGGEGQYSAGEEITVSTTIPGGWDFVAWQEGETQVSDASEFTYTMPARDVTLTAVFVEAVEPDPDRPPTPTATVSSIIYRTTGPHLNVTVTVVDKSDDTPIAGALVVADLRLGGATAASFTVTTDSAGTATYRYSRAPAGTYTTEITDVGAAGYEWDGEYPINEFIKR